MNYLKPLLTVLLLATASQTAHADEQGPTLAIDLGIARGNIGGVSGTAIGIHAGWRISPELALHAGIEGIVSTRGTGRNSFYDYDNPNRRGYGNEDIIGVGAKWWATNHLWASVMLGRGMRYRGPGPDQSGQAMSVCGGVRVGQHTSLVLSARATHYDSVNTAITAGLEFEWGAPSILAQR